MNNKRADFTDYYTENAAVFNVLDAIDPSAYQKYIDWMSTCPKGSKLLDVGCGTGLVANKLKGAGFDAYGVDANHLAIEKARQGPATFTLATDYRLPFEDGQFDGVGSYDVLEHMGDPETTLTEQVRVLRKGGQLIVSCPNFLQVVGIASHHPHTRGLIRKMANASSLAGKLVRYLTTRSYRFDMMEPIQRDVFEPDDDAIVVTNALDVCAALRRRGMNIVYGSGTSRYFPGALERLAPMPVLRSLVGMVFVVARKA